MKKSKNKNLLEKIFLILFAVSTIFSIGITVFSTIYFNIFAKSIQNNIEARLEMTAVLASETIVSGDELNNYWSLDDLEDENKALRYEEIRVKMQNFVAKHNLIYVYYMRNIGGGREQIILDSDPLEPLGLDYDEEMDDYTSHVFETEEPTCMKLGDYNSSWYGIIAAYAPVYDSLGNFVAIVGVDISDVEVLAIRQITGMFNWLFVVSSVFIATTAIALIILFRKKAQAYEVASISKSEFLSRMSHEIRTPLNAIIGMSEIARKSLPNAEKTLSSIDQVILASQHLLGVLNDVLDMSKIESGKLELSYASFENEDALNEIRLIIMERCREKEIDFVTNIDSIPNYTIIGDKLRLNQVLINLLGNAVKFTGEKGEIRFNIGIIDNDEKKVTFKYSVSDSGIGMTEEQVSRLFTPFEQATSSIAARFGGTGLGLSISQSLIKMMNSEIKVNSHLGIGSEFYFEVTFAKGDKVAAHKEINEENIDFSGKRILLVEDVAINRFIVSDILVPTKIEIVEVENGQLALDFFKKGCEGYFDLILMDVQMPVMDGYEATKLIRSLNRKDAHSIPIIAMTANAYKEDVEMAISVGMDEHLSKPIDFGKMMSILQKYLHK